MPPYSSAEHDLLVLAANDPKGLKLNGRAQKQVARMLARRGFGVLNKSVTRMMATPAGLFVLKSAGSL